MSESSDHRDHRSDRDRDRGGRRRPRSRRGDGLIGRGRKVVYRYKIRYKIFIFLIIAIGPKMGISINNMKIIHTSTFTIIHTNFNHYLETTQRKREIIIRRKESVSHKEDTIYEYIYYTKKSLKIIIVFFTLNNLLSFLDKKLLSKYSINADKKNRIII